MHGCRNPIAWHVPSPRFGGELNEPRCEPAPAVSASVVVVACSCEHCQVCVALCHVRFSRVCVASRHNIGIVVGRKHAFKIGHSTVLLNGQTHVLVLLHMCRNPILMAGFQFSLRPGGELNEPRWNRFQHPASWLQSQSACAFVCTLAAFRCMVG